MVQNKGLIFKKVPEGWPVIGEHLAIETRTFDLDAAPPKNGITVQHLVACFSPYQRGRMRSPEIKSYVPPFTLNAPFANRAIAKVLKSDNDTYQEGDVVIGTFNTEEYSAVGEEMTKGIEKLHNPYNLDPAIYLGALGMPGQTAYSSLYEIGKPRKGETIFISAASGAVGQLVGQLAKHEGLTVIGSVGDDNKLEFITKDLGFDGGFNYKKEKPIEALTRLAPDGIDIYYENVGGEHLDAALSLMKNFGRIGQSLIPITGKQVLTNPVCSGMVSQYNLPPDQRYGVQNLMSTVSKRLTIRGFLVTDPDFGPKYAAEHQENVAKWIHEGKFKVRMSTTDGIDNAAAGFLGMLEGKNFGKSILKIADVKSPDGET